MRTPAKGLPTLGFGRVTDAGADRGGFADASLFESDENALLALRCLP